MSATTQHPELADEEVSILESLAEEDDAVRRVDLADGIEDYPAHERELLDEGAINETGSLTTHEDDGTVTYRRFEITQTGGQLLEAYHAPPPEESDPVEPRRTSSREPWDVSAPFDELGPNIAQILDETQAVECVETDEYRGGWVVRVTLARDGIEGHIDFKPIHWHNDPGTHHFKTKYKHLFGGRHPDVTTRAFGALQRAWVEQYQQEDDTERGTEQSFSKGERVDQYLEAEYTGDESVREIADEVDVSTGTVHSRLKQFEDSEDGADTENED